MCRTESLEEKINGEQFKQLKNCLIERKIFNNEQEIKDFVDSTLIMEKLSE